MGYIPDKSDEMRVGLLTEFVWGRQVCVYSKSLELGSDSCDRFDFWLEFDLGMVDIHSFISKGCDSLDFGMVVDVFGADCDSLD